MFNMTVEEMELIVAPRWVKLMDGSGNIIGMFNTVTGAYKYY